MYSYGGRGEDPPAATGAGARARPAAGPLKMVFKFPEHFFRGQIDPELYFCVARNKKVPDNRVMMGGH